MSLFGLVTQRDTGTFGTFEVTAGNVSKNRKLILQFFNGSTALVPMDARASFTTAEEHSAFDQTLMALSTANVNIQYVESIGKFMDPKARFAEWLGGKLTPASVGISLTPEELAVPSAYESAKAKFVAAFTPATPVLPKGGIDIVAIFGADDAVEIDRWRKGERDTLPSSVLTKIATSQRDRGLLRLRAKGSGWLVENDRGHTITRTRFLSAYTNNIAPVWESSRSTTNRLTSFYVEAAENGNYSREKHVQVYATHIEIGCQSIPRAEVENAVAVLAEKGFTK